MRTLSIENMITGRASYSVPLTLALTNPVCNDTVFPSTALAFRKYPVAMVDEIVCSGKSTMALRESKIVTT
ncbi:hypothetical protein Mapa_009079 [Marchantia paleacea]|nr:hypothetical protein Mapa_009079 [Marchantia paleacea]